MTRPDAITRAQMPPSSRSNPLTPVIIGIIVVIVIFALLLLFTVVIPLTADHGAEKRTERFDTAVNTVVNQAMENVHDNGTIFQKEPSVPMSPGLLALEKPFEQEEEQEAGI